MMELNKKELQKIDRAFRTNASRLLNTHPGDAEKCLKMFIDLIDQTPLIAEYINSFVVVEIDVKKEVKEVEESWGRKAFDLGSTPEEEIVWTYQLLKYIDDQNVSFYSITRSYGGLRDSQQGIKGFGERVVLPFVSHIREYLKNIMIDMGSDEEVKYQIIVNANHNSQVNLAQDSATITATQNNGIDLEKLDKLIERITVLMPAGLQPDDKEVICESVEVIQVELKKEHPKKGLIKTAIRGLGMVAPSIAGTVDFAAAVSDLVQFAQPFLT